MKLSKLAAQILLVGSVVGAANATTVDALILYSDGAVNEYDGDIQTRLDHLMATTNKIYSDSGLDITLNSVKAIKYNLDDSQNSGDVLSQIQQDEYIKKLRDEVGADEVIIYRPYANDGMCGLAYQNNSLGDTSTANWAKEYTYAHVSIDCDSYTTAHEVGHNMGLGHSVKQDSTGAFSYARGYGVDNEFVTVMAYGSVYNASTIYKFSSPLLDCNGYACGVPEGNPDEADAVKALKFTVPLLAEFREHVVTEDDSTDDGTNSDSTNTTDDNTNDNTTVDDGTNNDDNLNDKKDQYDDIKNKFDDAKDKLHDLRDIYKQKKKEYLKNAREYKKLIRLYRKRKVLYDEVMSFYMDKVKPSYQAYKDAYEEYKNFFEEYKSLKDELKAAYKEYKEYKKLFG